MIFDKRIQRLAGEGGIVSQTISANVDRAEKEGFNKDALLRLLLATTQGSRLEIDPRTKRRLVRRVTLLNYFYMAARLLGGLRQETVADEILEHLEGIQETFAVCGAAWNWSVRGRCNPCLPTRTHRYRLRWPAGSPATSLHMVK